ncbi:MAG: replicative DNA helicase [bacterium]|nr:replicative DNA helicase [bacterium]
MSPKTPTLKLPPQDLEAERSVLGALLLDKLAITKVADLIAPGDFYHPAHQAICDAILTLFERGEPIDILTVSHALKNMKRLTEVGGTDYLSDLVQGVPTSAHVERYAEIVREKRVRRDLIGAAASVNESALDPGNFEDLLDNVEQRIFSISQRSRPQKFTHIKDELPAAYERLEKLHRGERGALRGIPTKFPKIDEILSGLQQSDLILIGARPSFGKTSFALDIARQTALAGHAVGIFSLEMSRDQVIDRLIAAQAQVPLWRLRTGRLNDEMEFSLVQQALDELAKIPIFIDDSATPNILTIRSMARRLQLEHGLELVIVDYLQLIQPRGTSDNMVTQVTEISHGLKALARELKVPVIAISQLSRDVDKRDVKVPRLSDLRESGSLEQDADIVMFLYRKDRDRLDISPEDQNTVEIIIAKHRNGPLGTVTLKFDPERVSFRSIDTIHETAGAEPTNEEPEMEL